MPEQTKYLCAVVKTGPNSFEVVEPRDVLGHEALDLLGTDRIPGFMSQTHTQPKYTTQHYVLVTGGNIADDIGAFRALVEIKVNDLTAADNVPLYKVQEALADRFTAAASAYRGSKDAEARQKAEIESVDRLLAAMVPYMVTRKPATPI